MNRRLLLAAILLQSSTHLLLGQAAQTPVSPSGPGEWLVKTYRYPATELVGGFVSSEHGQLTPPWLPPANAAEKDILEYMKRSHFVAAQHLISQGLTLPPGSLAVFDPKNKTLALRSTRLTHERMTALAAQAERSMPRHVHFTVQIIEADGAAVRAALKAVSARADHAAALAELDALVTQGKASYAGSLRMETKSGTRATVARGEGRMYISEMTVDEAQRSSTAMEERRTGTLFEMEPTVAADGETIELALHLEHHHGPPVEHWDKVNTSKTQTVEVPNIDFRLAKVVSSFTLLNGMTKVVGIWQPEDSPEPARAGRLQAAFVQARIVTLLPELSPRTEQLLRQHGEQVEKTPAAPPPAIPGETKGIIIRSFHIPADMLTMADHAADSPSDPFGPAPAAAAPMVNEPRLTMQVTALEILKSKGIPFPEGSSANFNPATGELLVRNTEANMKLVVEFINSVRKHSPKNLAMTLHIVEAPAAALRRLERETLAITDHSAAWRAMEEEVMQNKARILRSAFIEARPGTRCTFHTGREFLFSTGGVTTSVEDHSQQTPGSDAKGPVTQVQMVAGGIPRFAVDSEQRHVGLSFESESSLDADGETVELNYQLRFDYAEPTTTDSSALVEAQTIRPLNRAIRFHQAELNTATTLMSGTSRLLSIWKPEGSAELDKADVLQAAFLTLDVVPVDRGETP